MLRSRQETVKTGLVRKSPSPDAQDLVVDFYWACIGVACGTANLRPWLSLIPWPARWAVFSKALSVLPLRLLVEQELEGGA